MTNVFIKGFNATVDSVSATFEEVKTTLNQQAPAGKTLQISNVLPVPKSDGSTDFYVTYYYVNSPANNS